MLLNQSNEVNKKKRAFSAKTPSTRSRPLSGMTTKVAQKTQLLQGIYTGGSSPFKKQKSKGLFFQGIKTEELQKYKKQPGLKTTKNREQLFEQNMGLKKQINRLQQQLSILKGRFEANKRRASSKSKQMDIEFEKQMYWGGSKSHLISGIKYQYQKLKKDHSKKCRDYEELKIALLESKVPQYKIYAENVEVENKRLTQKLQKMLVFSSSQIEIKDQNSKQISEYMYMEAEDKKKQMEDKIQEIDIKLKAANENLSDRDKKIMFLQKLIIEKDNREFHTMQKARRVEKVKEQMHEENEKLKETVEKLLYSSQKRVEEIKSEKEKEMIQQKAILNRKIEDKQKIINELNEDNKYLEAAINKLRVSASITELSQAKMQNTNSKQLKVNEFGKIVGSIELKKSELNQKEEDTFQRKKQNKEQSKRVQKTADRKHNEEAKKVRRVERTQIEEITQLVKYRLIAYNIDFNGIKKLFHHQFQAQEWDKEYISMRQVVDRLCQKPFCLEASQSQILGRYIIEDSTEEYVYCDYGNQHKREVVKSIVRALVGEYDLGSREEAEKDFEEVINKYQSNIESALEKLYPGGKISNRRLIEIMSSLGVEAPATFYPLLIAKLAQESKNLNQLEFRRVFK